MSNDTPTRLPLPGDDPVFQPDMVRTGPPHPSPPFEYAPEPRKRFQHVWWKHIALFVLTAASTYANSGPWYSVGVLSILGAHEMGHYLACRYYGIDATLPYFIPMPLTLFGTLGAWERPMSAP